MKRWFQLLRAENIRAWKIFPKMLLQAIVLALAAMTIAFCAAKILYQDNVLQIQTAVVMEEENQLTEFAYEYVKETEKDIEFVKCSKEEAFEGLKKGRFAAAIVLGDKLIEGILNGQNPSVLVICNEGFAGAGIFLKELTQAGADMLSIAQAEIYAVYELAEELGATEALPDIQNSINWNNLDMAMGRGSLFQYREVSATGELPVRTYYLASAVTILLLFMGIPMGMFLKTDSKVALKQYKRAGIGAAGGQAARWLTVFFLYAAVICLTAVFTVWFQKDGIQNVIMPFIGLWLSAGSMAAFELMIYEAVERKSSAVLLLTFLSVILIFLSGGIVPRVFFPESVRNVAEFLPSSFWIEGIGSAVMGKFDGTLSGISILYGLGFFSVSVYFRHRNTL